MKKRSVIANLPRFYELGCWFTFLVGAVLFFAGAGEDSLLPILVGMASLASLSVGRSEREIVALTEMIDALDLISRLVSEDKEEHRRKLACDWVMRRRSVPSQIGMKKIKEIEED